MLNGLGGCVPRNYVRQIVQQLFEKQIKNLKKKLPEAPPEKQEIARKPVATQKQAAPPPHYHPAAKEARGHPAELTGAREYYQDLIGKLVCLDFE